MNIYDVFAVVFFLACLGYMAHKALMTRPTEVRPGIYWCSRAPSPGNAAEVTYNDKVHFFVLVYGPVEKARCPGAVVDRKYIQSAVTANGTKIWYSTIAAYQANDRLCTEVCAAADVTWFLRYVISPWYLRPLMGGPSLDDFRLNAPEGLTALVLTNAYSYSTRVANGAYDHLPYNRLKPVGVSFACALLASVGIKQDEIDRMARGVHGIENIAECRVGGMEPYFIPFRVQTSCY